MTPAVARPPTPLRRRLLLLAAATLVTLAAVVAAAPLWLAGPRLGRLVERNLPHTRGHVHVGGGSWGWGTVLALLRHHPAALVFDDVSLTDPDGVVVLRARRISCALLRDHAPEGVTIQDLRVEDGFWRMARTADRHGIGFLRALEPARSTPGRSGPAAQGTRAAQGPTGLRFLHVQGAELADLDVDFDLPGWTLSLRGLHGQGSLGLERSDAGPDTFTFAVVDAAPAGGGRLSVLDGKWRTTLPFSAAHITRIAATAAAPDAIALDASQITTGRSMTTLRGSFMGVLPAPGPAKRAAIDLTVAMQDAADAAEAVAAARGWTPGLAIAGDHATLAMTFAGSLSAPRLQARALGFDVRRGEAVAHALGFQLDAQLATRQVYLREVTLTSPAGGRLLANGHLDGDRVAGTLSLEHFDASPYLPPGLRQAAAGNWNGAVEGHVDLAAGEAALDRVALTLARPPTAAGPTAVHALTAGQPLPRRTAGDAVLRLGQVRLERGTLVLPRVVANLAGGQVTAVGSLQLWDPVIRTWLPSPAIDVRLAVAGLSIERLLGARLISGQLSLQARARGTFEALTLQARLTGGQRVRMLGGTMGLPAVLSLSLAGGTITLAPLTLTGAAGETLAARGTITTAGRLAFQARATSLPLRPLIAWAAGVPANEVPVDGRLATELALAGDLAAPSATGTVTLEGAQFRGQPLGGGVLAITTGAQGQLRAHGMLVDALPLDAVLQLAPSGARLTATLTLDRVALDPFLVPLAARLPAARMTGEASGILALSLSPGAAPKLEATLSHLALSARAPGSVPGPPLTLESPGPVHVTARLGAIRLDPARFSGSAGDLLLAGEWRGDSGSGRARGRLKVAAFAPWAGKAVTSLDGELDVDATLGFGRGGATAAGSVTIAAPVRARLATLPFDVAASAGRLVLGDHGASVDDLVLEVAGARLRAAGRFTVDGVGPPRVALSFRGAFEARRLEALARGYLRDAEGEASVTGHLDGVFSRPVLHARLNVAGVAFTLMPGANRLRFAGGDIAVQGGTPSLTASLSHVDLRIGDGNQLVVGGDAGGPGRVRLTSGGALEVDLPAQGRVRALATPVAIVDSAAFGVRLTGVPGESLRLAGTIFIDAAHVPPSLRRPKKPAPAAPGDTARAVLNATRLDLRIRSQPRAVTVEVAHVPDLHAALDYHLGGTVGTPEAKGSLKPAGVYSAVAFFLARLLE